MKELSYEQLRELDQILRLPNDVVQLLFKGNFDAPRGSMEYAICRARMILGLPNTKERLTT